MENIVSEQMTNRDRRLNRTAVTALVMAIFQLNVFAVVMGFLALRGIKKQGQRGVGLAISAIVIGGIQTLLLAWIVSDPYGAGAALGSLVNSIESIFGPID
jgi:hypothetical protein